MKTKPVIGIALDLNLESVSGIRIDDLIKRSIRNLYSELKQDFIFYLHNPKSDLHDLESNEINENYFSAELNDFSLPCPFKFQTVLNDLLARVTNHCDSPVLVIITNRYFEEQKYHYELMLRNSLKKDLNCNVVLVGVGDNYDKDSFSSLSNFSSAPFLDCDFVHLELNELEELNNVLLSSLKGGEDQIVLDAPSNTTLTKKIISNKKNIDKSMPTLATAHYCATFDPSGGFNISGDVEVNVEDDLCEQDKVHCEVGGVSLKAKGCAEVDVVAKKSVKSMKRTTKKPTKKTTKKKVNKKENETGGEDK